MTYNKRRHKNKTTMSQDKTQYHNVSPQYHDFLNAVRRGNLEQTKLFLPSVDPKTNNSEALKNAAERGHLEIIRLLLPLSKPKANKSAALAWAAYGGNLEAVKLLLPVSNPKADESNALYWACDGSHFDIIDLLYPVSDVSVVLKTVDKDQDQDTFKAPKTKGVLLVSPPVKAQFLSFKNLALRLPLLPAVFSVGTSLKHLGRDFFFSFS